MNKLFVCFISFNSKEPSSLLTKLNDVHIQSVVEITPPVERSLETFELKGADRFH